MKKYISKLKKYIAKYLIIANNLKLFIYERGVIMKIYIIRHGEVPGNVLRTYCYNDEDLTAKGVSQAKELREKIKAIDFDIIISSPLIRTQHTANIININNKKIIIDNRLRERNPGNLAGQPLNTTNREEYWNYNTTIQYGTSENIKVFMARVYDFLNELKTKQYNSVLIVSHSGVSKAFSCYFMGIQDGMLMRRGLKNCEIKEYNL